MRGSGSSGAQGRLEAPVCAVCASTRICALTSCSASTGTLCVCVYPRAGGAPRTLSPQLGTYILPAWPHVLCLATACSQSVCPHPAFSVGAAQSTSLPFLAGAEAASVRARALGWGGQGGRGSPALELLPVLLSPDCVTPSPLAHKEQGLHQFWLCASGGVGIFSSFSPPGAGPQERGYSSVSAGSDLGPHPHSLGAC